MTLEENERLIAARTEGRAANFEAHWTAGHFVRLTNYGDGTAYDIKLQGIDCRPRVWVGDMGSREGGRPDGEVIQQWPMWSDDISALEPGKSVTVWLNVSQDKSQAQEPILDVSWPLLPKRGLYRKSVSYDLAKVRMIEVGYPGNREA